MMEQNFNLIISGKQERLGLDAFLAALGMKGKLLQGPLSFVAAMEILSADEKGGLLMVAAHRGQHILLEDRAELLGITCEKRILSHTRATHGEVLALTLADDAGISWYNYYRDGKLARSVTFEGTDSDEIGKPIVYEKSGMEPHKVLTSFCDQWKNLLKLEWEVYAINP